MEVERVGGDLILKSRAQGHTLKVNKPGRLYAYAYDLFVTYQ